MTSERSFPAVSTPIFASSGTCVPRGELPLYVGTGKTSLILALAKDLFGPPEAGGLVKERVLEMNASDERGINSIREKVFEVAGLKIRSARTSISKHYSHVLVYQNII